MFYRARPATNGKPLTPPFESGHSRLSHHLEGFFSLAMRGPHSWPKTMITCHGGGARSSHASHRTFPNFARSACAVATDRFSSVAKARQVGSFPVVAST